MIAQRTLILSGVTTMKTIAIASSNISGAEYDELAQQLYITFHSGAKYRYDGVSQEDADAFAAAPSAGKHFHNEIKDSFSATRVG